MTTLIRAADHGHHHHDPHIGYSFAKFSGPVSGMKIISLTTHVFNSKIKNLPLGPAKEIVTHDQHHGHQVDYVAKPDYQFEYG